MRDALHRRVYGRTPEQREASKALIIAADSRAQRLWKLAVRLEGDPAVELYRAEKLKRSGHSPRKHRPETA